MKIDVVVVTFNRLEKLKRALVCYEEQTTPVRNLIVVDNHSTDGTAEFLNEWKRIPSTCKKHLITNSENLGGSGGFYIGEKYAMGFNPDWIYVSDDDAYPARDVLEKFVAFLERYKNLNLSAVSGITLKQNGERHHVATKCKMRLGFKITTFEADLHDYEKEYFEADVYVYVGLFLNAQSLKTVGLCNPDFFIYLDDTEHALRMRKVGRIVVVPSIKIVHDSGIFEDRTLKGDNSWRRFYLIRNQIAILQKPYPLVAPFYAVFFLFVVALQEPMFKRNCKFRKLVLRALIDGMLGRLGRHPLYKPGFTIV